MKVFLLVNSATIRKRLANLLFSQPGIELMGQDQDPLAAINAMRIQRPDAVILDSVTERKLGIDMIRTAKRITPSPAVILLTHRVFSDHRINPARTKADFVLDKFVEWKKVTEILAGFSSTCKA